MEVDKPPKAQGYYLHPELFGAPPEQAIFAILIVPIGQFRSLRAATASADQRIESPLVALPA